MPDPAAVVRPVFVSDRSDHVAGWDDNRGRLTWTTLFSGDLTPTDTMTAGVAQVEPGGFLAAHRHPPAEIYYMLEGTAHITVGEVTREVGPGTGVFIPGDVEHAVVNRGASPVRFLYVFAVDRFENVQYDFS